MFVRKLQAAFPPSLHGTVEVVASKLKKSAHGPTDPRIVTLRGMDLKIPYRIYNDVRWHSRFLSREATLILNCIMTRHHDGHRRQQAATRLYERSEEWTAPFVLLLVGEYVVEIVRDIETALLNMDVEMYRRLASMNVALVQTTHRRVTSYWNEYYRTSYSNPQDYPGFRVLEELTGLK